MPSNQMQRPSESRCARSAAYKIRCGGAGVRSAGRAALDSCGVPECRAESARSADGYLVRGGGIARLRAGLKK